MSNLQIGVWGLLSVMLLLAVRASWENPSTRRTTPGWWTGIFHRLCYWLLVADWWRLIRVYRLLELLGVPYEIRVRFDLWVPHFVRRAGASESLRRKS